MEKRNVTKFRRESLCTPNYKFHVKEEPVTPNNEEFDQHNNLEYSFDCGDLKKSLSMSDIAGLREELMNLELIINKEEVNRRYRISTAHRHDQLRALSRSQANPFPKSVIEGPHLPEVPKRPLTLLEPFNLTEMPKKILSLEPVKARQAPNHILEKPQIPAKPPVHVTKPVQPNHRQVKPVEKPVEKPVQHHGRPIRPKPFSFEKRDEEMKRRKEEKIKKQIEEEKQLANQFKAHPLPRVVRKVMMKTAAKVCSSTASSENKENFKFEARPAVVLYKKPFKPVLKPLQIVKPTPFALSYEMRAAERAKFDKYLKEKEEEQEKLRQLREREAKEIEEKQIAEIRAKLVHHPKPLHIAEPFLPQRSAMPLTVPVTPKVMRRLKQQ